VSTDLDNGPWTKLAESEYSLPSGVRHGNAVAVTQSELNALIAKWDPANAVKVKGIIVAGANSINTITTKGGTLQMVEAVAPDNATNKLLTWSVTNETGSATISTSGLLTAVSNGTVTVKATAKDGSNVVSNAYMVTISGQDVKVTGITVAGADSINTITTKGGTLQMVEAVAPNNATNKLLTWSVTNGTGSATISTSGLLTAITDGTVTVKATAQDGSNIVSNLYTVTISGQTNVNEVKVTGITLKGKNGVNTITTKAGILEMVPTVTPDNATNKLVTWSVANGTGSASISEAGILTAITDGTVTVKATAKDGSNVVSNLYTVTISGQSSGNGGGNGGGTGNGNSGGSGKDNTTTTPKDKAPDTTTPPKITFNDMKNYQWAKEAVETLAAEGIISIFS